jgi:hypothetical protein
MRLKEGLRRTVNGRLSAAEQASKQKPGTDNGNCWKRVTSQLLRTFPGLYSRGLSEVSALSNRLAPQIVELVGPVLSVMRGAAGQKPANAVDVAPHGVELYIDASCGWTPQAELSEQSVYGHGSLRVCW